jgi:hypothetical protein
MLVRVLADELRSDRINVNEILPRWCAGRHGVWQRLCATKAEGGVDVEDRTH